MSMGCDVHADAILEHALGEPASAELQAHLRECDPCRAALEREQRLVGRIDGELRQAVAVVPSVEFLPRVRQRAASRTETQFAPWMRWLVPVAATLALVTWLRQPTAIPAAQPVATSSVVPRPEIPVPVPTAPAKPAPPRMAAVRTPAPRRPQPEVLVPPGEEALLRRFVATLRSGRFDGSALVQPDAAPPPDLGIVPLAEMPSLDLKPLTAESNTEGVIP